MTTHQSRSAHLVSVISTNNKKIEEYLKEQRLPPLSLGPDGPLDVQLPPEIEQCRQRLVDASLELGDLATGPVELRLVPGWSAITMFTVTKFIFDFDIVHKVPLTGDISYGDLSTAVNVSTSVLRQVLRAGMPYHMFYEPQPGFVAHTATTKVMVHKPLIKDWTGLNTDVLLPSAAGLTDALKKYPAANDITQTSFQVAKGGGETGFYLYMEKHPAQAERFAGVMAAFQHDKSYATEHLIESWPGDVKSGKVVDLGGSTGAVAFALATQYPKLDIVVQDLPGALKAAQIQEGRNVSFMAHDFFSEQPILGADMYVEATLLISLDVPILTLFVTDICFAGSCTTGPMHTFIAS